MSFALQAFMDQLVDYAGLFPPASLDMTSAVRGYAGHQAQAESWMLGRFIVPADRLGEMAAEAEKYLSASERWGVSVLMGHREDSEQSLALLKDQCASIIRFEKLMDPNASVDVLEIPLPAKLIPAEIPGFLTEYFDGLKNFGVLGKELFLEISPNAPQEHELPILEAVSALAKSRSGAGRAVLRLGAKLRCGGVTADAFPSVDRISRILAYCRDLGLALKCTAGLHHPVRHQATDPVVLMHGFLNVFGAGLLAHAHGWSAEELSRVIEDTDPSSFVFESDHFSWRGHVVPLDTMRVLRTQFLCGFGSCSFDEPRDDLLSLGLL